jgi:hypothetical protein
MPLVKLGMQYVLALQGLLAPNNQGHCFMDGEIEAQSQSPVCQCPYLQALFPTHLLFCEPRSSCDSLEKIPGTALGSVDSVSLASQRCRHLCPLDEAPGEEWLAHRAITWSKLSMKARIGQSALHVDTAPGGLGFSSGRDEGLRSLGWCTHFPGQDGGMWWTVDPTVI